MSTQTKKGFMENSIKAEKRYPHVVIRWMATVYQPFPVIFSPTGTPSRTDAFVVCMDTESFDQNGVLTLAARNALVETTKTESQTKKRRMCIVFGKEDCVYCEPDGKAEASNSCPSGGISLGLSKP